MQKYLKIGPYLQEIKITINMKIILSFFLVSIAFFQDIHKTTTQNQQHTTRLFYIQHSDNHNTYVYDANIKAGIIDSSQPINTYRIVYTQMV
jgi:hypothetical protein